MREPRKRGCEYVMSMCIYYVNAKVNAAGVCF